MSTNQNLPSIDLLPPPPPLPPPPFQVNAQIPHSAQSFSNPIYPLNYNSQNFNNPSFAYNQYTQLLPSNFNHNNVNTENHFPMNYPYQFENNLMNPSFNQNQGFENSKADVILNVNSLFLDNKDLKSCLHRLIQYLPGGFFSFSLLICLLILSKSL